MDNDREELLRQKAYAIWEREGRPDGEHGRHWDEASIGFSDEDDVASDEATETPANPAAELLGGSVEKEPVKDFVK